MRSRLESQISTPHSRKNPRFVEMRDLTRMALFRECGIANVVRTNHRRRVRCSRGGNHQGKIKRQGTHVIAVIASSGRHSIWEMPRHGQRYCLRRALLGPHHFNPKRGIEPHFLTDAASRMSSHFFRRLGRLCPRGASGPASGQLLFPGAAQLFHAVGIHGPVVVRLIDPLGDEFLGLL